MTDNCYLHPEYLEVVSDTDREGVATKIVILCHDCGSEKRVWPEKETKFFCRLCGHYADRKPVGSWGCDKCNTSVPMVEVEV
jgi:ribosomal protein S27E